MWETSISLNPLAVYVVAIDLMYGLSKQSWSKQVELIESGLLVVLQTPEYNVIIYTSHQTTDLTTGLCVQILYQAVNCMATRNPGFYQSTNFATLRNRPIARLLITDLDHWDFPPIGTSNSSIHSIETRSYDLVNSLEATETTSPTSTPTADSGELTDPDDNLFKIRYQYSGQRVLNGDVFSAAIDGLAMAAQYDSDGPCDSITALSISRKVVWHIGRSTTHPTFTSELTRVFFLMIRDLFLKERRFQELWFHLEYEGEIVADGYVIKWNEKPGIANE